MTKFKTILKKGWVFVVAGALIVGSASAMAAMLDVERQAIPSPTIIVDETVATDLDTTTSPEAAPSDPATTEEVKPSYELVDQPQQMDEFSKAVREKLSYDKKLTPEEIEKKIEEAIAKMTPTDKDISAEAAAEISAKALLEIFGADLNGTKATASYYQYDLPYSDSWTVSFEPADKENSDSLCYSVLVDSVSGKVMVADGYRWGREEKNTDIDSRDFTALAEGYVTTMLKDGVTVTSSSVKDLHTETGVMVLLELSNGKAYAVRLAGSEKKVYYVTYFANGYDGSLEKKPIDPNAVG